MEIADFLTALAIFCGDMTASFFFSGTEIGFYRASKAKVVLEALLGSRRSRFLLWLVNHPPIFISTVLLGNNLANNFVSLGAVLIFQVLFPDSSAALLSTVVATPFVFIYGELLPKSIFLLLPNRLLKLSVPFFWILVPIFLPVSLFLSGLNFLIAWLLGEKNTQYALQMSDAELKQMIGEGKSAGILHPVQETLAVRILQLQTVPLSKYSVPLKKFPVIHEKMMREEMIQTARKFGAGWVLVQKNPNVNVKSHLEGFCFFHDLLLMKEGEPLPLRPLLTLPVSTRFASAMGKMFSAEVPFAVLKNVKGEFIGAVLRQLQHS